MTIKVNLDSIPYKAGINPKSIGCTGIKEWIPESNVDHCVLEENANLSENQIAHLGCVVMDMNSHLNGNTLIDFHKSDDFLAARGLLNLTTEERAAKCFATMLDSMSNAMQELQNLMNEDYGDYDLF